MTTPPPPQDSESLPTRRARVESIDLFEVKKEELDLIEAGLKSTPTILAFAMFSASVAVAFLIAILTTKEYKWSIIESVFSGIVFSGVVLSILLFIFWKRNRSSENSLITTIRDRMKNGNGHSSDEEDLPA